MNIKEEILKEHSKKQAQRVANFIGGSEDKFNKLMQLFLGDSYVITQRAAWIVSHCVDMHPSLILPYVEKMVLNLKNEPPVAVVRNTVRVLQEVEIPEELWGLTADVCFGLLSSQKQPVAVKAFSMTILANICVKVPELKNELKLLIEDQLPFGTPGFISRGNKTLKMLAKLPDK